MKIALGEGSFYQVLGLFSLLLISLQGSNGLRDVRMTSPLYVRYGEDVNLVCSYDIERGALYAVKWYWNKQEFYRYVPKEVPPQQVFQQGHLSVNVTGSNDHVVILRSVSFEISGKFKCVVTAELTFETLQDEQDVIVVAVGYASLYLDQDSYHVSETGRANCSIDSTSPPANITWFMNELEINNKTRQETMITPDKEDSRMVSVLSTLYFDIPDFLPFKLKCKAEVYSISSESASVIIQPKPRAVVVAASNSENLFRLNQTTSASNKYIRGLMSNAACGREFDFLFIHLRLALAGIFVFSV